MDATTAKRLSSGQFLRTASSSQQHTNLSNGLPVKRLKRVAEAPFDKDSDGDCIIRSSDRVDFKASRAILSVASPLLSASLKKPNEVKEEDASQAPEVPLEEDSETVDVLLRCIYPIKKPTVKSFDLAYRLAKACERLRISTSCLYPVQFLLSQVDFVKENPVEAYALAWRLGYKNAAMDAAKHVGEERLSVAVIKANLIEISGCTEALLALYEFRKKQEDTILRLCKGVEASLQCRARCFRETRETESVYRARVAMENAFSRRTSPVEAFHLFSGLKYQAVPCDIHNAGQTIAAMIQDFPHTITWPENRPQ